MAHPPQPAIAAPGDNTGEQTHFDLNLDSDQLKIGLCPTLEKLLPSLTHSFDYVSYFGGFYGVGGGLAASNEIYVMYMKVVLCPLKGRNGFPIHISWHRKWLKGGCVEGGSFLLLFKIYSFLYSFVSYFEDFIFILKIFIICVLCS